MILLLEFDEEVAEGVVVLFVCRGGDIDEEDTDDIEEDDETDLLLLFVVVVLLVVAGAVEVAVVAADVGVFKLFIMVLLSLIKLFFTKLLYE